MYNTDVLGAKWWTESLRLIDVYLNIFCLLRARSLTHLFAGVDTQTTLNISVTFTYSKDTQYKTDK